MHQHQKLTRLTASIYDAALDSALWPDVLTEIAEFTGGQVCGLLAKDATRKCVRANCQVGVDDNYMRLYKDTYCQYGPLANTLCGDIEQILSIPDLLPYDEFRRGRFYREWAEPQGWTDVAMIALERSATSSAYLNVARHEGSGMVDDEMRLRLSLIVPHMRRAMSISKTIDSKEAETATFADIFDGLNSGLFIVDANCGIVHANTAGKDILSTGDWVAGRIPRGYSIRSSRKLHAYNADTKTYG